MPTSSEKLSELRAALAAGSPVADAAFDRLYPRRMRALSPLFWTPARVAQRAATLLAPTPETRILDVGSGVGKLCIVAAAQTGAQVTGIEHRRSLVRIAREVAARLGAPARFVQGDLAGIDWWAYDAFYFFNPFNENVHSQEHIDETVELSSQRFTADVRVALRGLANAKVGTRVVTYHGLGAALPATYRLLESEDAATDRLKLWVQTPDVVRPPRGTGAALTGGGLV